MKSTLASFALRSIVVLLAVFVGAVVTLCLTAAYQSLFGSALMAEHVYTVIVYLVIPLGCILGGITGMAFSFGADDLDIGARIFRIGGWLSFELILLLAFFDAHTWRLSAVVANLLGLFIVPFAWSILLICAGYRPTRVARRTDPSRQG